MVFLDSSAASRCSSSIRRCVRWARSRSSSGSPMENRMGGAARGESVCDTGTSVPCVAYSFSLHKTTAFLSLRGLTTIPVTVSSARSSVCIARASEPAQKRLIARTIICQTVRSHATRHDQRSLSGEQHRRITAERHVEQLHHELS